MGKVVNRPKFHLSNVKEGRFDGPWAVAPFYVCYLLPLILFVSIAASRALALIGLTPAVDPSPSVVGSSSSININSPTVAVVGVDDHGYLPPFLLSYLANTWNCAWLVFGVIPLLDMCIPDDDGNPTDDETKRVSGDLRFKVPLWLWPLAQTGTLAAGTWAFGRGTSLFSLHLFSLFGFHKFITRRRRPTLITRLYKYKNPLKTLG